MGEDAIVIDKLSKCYRIARPGKHARTWRERLQDGLGRLGRDPARSSTIWALRDISLGVPRGEVTGIIGGNGAGKSTLLKILSRITAPSHGSAEIAGRVGSLLEVGTGFHAELSGHDNIYLSGAILGMRKAEIDRRFAAIVAFAEVEKFIDTPIKHYSSGMHMRLAFAVAAHLDSEILLVDEVLAIGDIAFQEKCLAKMDDFVGHGRTVVLVSHNMATITNLCSQVAVLEHGELAFLGPPRQAVTHYLDQQLSGAGDDQAARRQLATLPPDPDLHLLDVQLRQPGAAAHRFRTDAPIEVAISYQVPRRVLGLRIGFDVRSVDPAVIAFRTYADDANEAQPATEPGRYLATATIPARLLAPTAYYLSLIAVIVRMRAIVLDQVRIRFDVMSPGGSADRYGARRPGIVLPWIDWRTVPDPDPPAVSDHGG